MTGTGRYWAQTERMDLIELTRTIQADKEREIEAAGRTRRLLAADEAAERTGWRQRWSRPSRARQRPVSTGTLSR
jgi:hypothetical protein